MIKGARRREGIMEDLIGRLVANVGLKREVAVKAVGIILSFLLKEGPTEKVEALIAMLPGADTALSASGDSPGVGGVMGAGAKLMAAGLSMAQVQSVTREVITYAREKAGEDAVGQIVGAIPGLGQFL
jgi:hypothetical protein